MPTNDVHTQFLMNLNILFVDNEQIQLDIIKEYIELHGGICKTAMSLPEAIELIEVNQFDLALFDIRLNNGHQGLDLAEHAKKIDEDLTVILVTGYTIEDMISMLITKDVYAVLQKPFDMILLGLLLLQASKNTRNARKNKYVADHLRDKIDQIQSDRDKIFLNTLLSLSNALEQKDEYTQNHSEKVAEISEKICLEYSTSEKFIEDVVIAGRLHDIGKIGLPDDILFAKRKLTDEEFAVVKKHVDMSYKIVKPVDVIGTISTFVLHHHERWNGEGYPHQLKEKGIPSGSRILAVADVYNALVSNRPYRTAMNIEDALQILFDGRSILFDAEIVDILYKLIKLGKVKA
jgi:response regulator RpfG family c-di-GMP phosphodiesterase